MTPTSTEAWQRLDACRSDFNEFLHELRTRALHDVEDAGPTLLSAGCSGRWYFDWIRESYRGELGRHIGVEAYSPKPPDLPSEALWIDNALDRMTDVGDASVDLVFAGQVIEHLWPEVLAGFLVEAHRVLRPGGAFVLDSPERSVTEQIGWTQPEHTIELTCAEALELVTLAGFVDARARGIWLCRDPETGSTLPLEPSEPDWQHRVGAAAERPDDSFVWWIECHRGDGPPNVDALRERCLDLWWRTWPLVANRISTNGRRERRHDADLLHADAGPETYLLYGPYAPLAPGDWEVELVIDVSGLDPSLPGDTTVFEVDAVHGPDDSTLARRVVTADEVRSANGVTLAVALPFRCEATVFSWQRRVLSHGIAPVTIHAHLTQLRAGLDRPHPLPGFVVPPGRRTRSDRSPGADVGDVIGRATEAATRVARRATAVATRAARRATTTWHAAQVRRP